MARPNILLLTSDQQHGSLLGCLNPEVKTPRLDELATQGTLFQRAYCPNPTCTPTRASIITGKYPSQHGAYSLGTKLDEAQTTVGDLLRQDGYRTALIGKAHFQQLKGTEEYPSLESYPILQDLDFWRTFRDPFYGFEHVRLCRNHVHEAHVGQHYAIWMEEKGLTDWRQYFMKPTGPLDWEVDSTWALPERYHYNTFITEESNRYLSECAAAGEPFFLWASYPDPHPPYLVPEPWASMYDPAKVTVPEVTPGEHDRNPRHFQLTQTDNPDFSFWDEPGGNALHGCQSHLFDRGKQARRIATYYGMMSFTDQHVGRILDHLESLGLAENTLVVFTSDHGHMYGQHGMTAKGPFHYEDLVRVPFIARWPGKIAPSRRSDSLVSLVDLAPTFLEATGLSIPGEMTGKSQLAHWSGEAPPARDHVTIENQHNPTHPHVLTYVNERFKLTVYRDLEEGELFDLQEDPNEVHNLWDAPEAQDRKRQLLHKMIQAELAKAPVPMPRVSGA